MLPKNKPTKIQSAKGMLDVLPIDAPLWQQYFRYFGAILHGDLGRSMRDGRDAISLVAVLEIFGSFDHGGGPSELVPDDSSKGD